MKQIDISKKYRATLEEIVPIYRQARELGLNREALELSNGIYLLSYRQYQRQTKILKKLGKQIKAEPDRNRRHEFAEKFIILQKATKGLVSYMDKLLDESWELQSIVHQFG